ncbi:hypothetical protein CKJ70_05285 [Mycobacterium avium]|jgi:hypothetical protein|nr:hypothetical protein CKJ70_05285 [Mycobacterium avium]
MPKPTRCSPQSESGRAWLPQRPTLFAFTRFVLDSIRATAWQHDIDDLGGHGGGRTSSQF